jgi:hypothetical protein
VPRGRRARLVAQLTKMPPALLAPPIRDLPGTMWGVDQRPGTSVHSSTTAHTIRVAPRMTSTSPSPSAPETICSPMASTALEPRTASPTLPTATPLASTRGSRSTLTPHSPATASSHRSPSNSGELVKAVAKSVTASPERAKFATAGANQ